MKHSEFINIPTPLTFATLHGFSKRLRNIASVESVPQTTLWSRSPFNIVIPMWITLFPECQKNVHGTQYSTVL